MPEETGFVIVAVSPGLAEYARRLDDLRALAREASSVDLSRILADYPECPIEKVVSGASAKTLLELEARAERRGYPRERSLTSFWRIDARKTSLRRQLLERLGAAASVDYVHPEFAGSDPQVDPTDDAFAALALHLDAAPVGVDARWAWTQPHGCGALVRFVDLEQGWTLNHEDLPAIAALPDVPQDINSASSSHGTAVMGIAVGVDNQVGIVGIAPTPDWVSIASHYRSADQTSGHVAVAISQLLIAGHIGEGDVLLIEYQDHLNRPIEVEQSVWLAIELATALGIVVVEAAGNGNLDLDTVPVLNRTDTSTFKESRAIIVGAGQSALDPTGAAHERWMLAPPPGPGSNFGSRVDCYGYGDNVVTTGPAKTRAGSLGGTNPTDEYRSDFGGTSAAAAIVAGAAVVLQGLHKAIKGAPLSPLDMRKALSGHGTPQGAGLAGHIGVMPDLRKAAAALDLAKGINPIPASPTNLRIVT